ncbi:hypothetical protein [Novosphingobium panipatense]|uniref:Glycoside hydrolase n=2 Tax=Novosphingobium panipatense TaxID=428991 RepID=A0ABY1QHT9_9SPHN|nr:hypothetical protein [Novosphingobium panipatense]SMP69995.1 hypothetical protein SAMN06296065_105219 [Novosphingobium panipatense]
MELTAVGALQLLLALALFGFGSLTPLFALVVASTLLGGSAAVFLPALGGSSVSPAHFALGLLLLRCVLPGGVAPGAMRAAVEGNAWLVLFVAYGILAALVLPRLFEGALDVTPLRGQLRERYGSETARILAAAPLRFTAQNLTTAIYMAGTLGMALAAHAVVRMPRGSEALVRTGATLALVHGITGFASVALRDTPVDTALGFFRNGAYAQLDHRWEGFVRMNGIWPEASSFAAFGVGWFVFNFECWLRRVEPHLTGPAALVLGLALLASTSTTAYVGLALSGGALLVRAATTPGLIAPDRLAWLSLVAIGAVIAVSALLVLDPLLAAAMRKLLEHTTVDKAASFSGRQRLFWARQGIDAFVISHGLGIGPGSFRSSSLATAILGSTGVVGAVAFLAHLLRTLGPLALSTYRPVGDRQCDIGASAAWAVLVGAGVASVSAPSCDPGLTFAILSGSAIALRGRTRPLTSSSAAPAAPAQAPA